MTTTLQWLQTGQVWTLAGREEWVCGRQRDNQVVLPDASLGRRHARILRARMRGRWFLYDNCTNNGSWVNGLRIDDPSQQVEIVDGDVLRLGDVLLLRFTSDETGAPQAIEWEPDVVVSEDELRSLSAALSAEDGWARARAARALTTVTAPTAREILRGNLPEALAADDILVVHHIVTALASTRDAMVHALLTGRLAVTPAGEHERLAFYRRAAARMQAGG